MMTKDKQYQVVTGAKLYTPSQEGSINFVIPNKREFVAESILVLLETYLLPDQKAVNFDYRLLRGQTNEDARYIHRLIRDLLDAQIMFADGEPVVTEATRRRLMTYVSAFVRTFYDRD